MIKAVIFDFDGVLVESADIKTLAFRKLFSRWPDKIDEILEYHIENMGISRYVKFRHFYENILREEYSETAGEELARQFSEIVVDEIKAAPIVKGTEKFLKQNCDNYLLFIASGTPQKELEDIASFKQITVYFKEIYGSPNAKADVVEKILKDYSLEKYQAVLVGDADSDRRAAQRAGIPFVARINNENSFLYKEKWKINDLTELTDIINELNKIVESSNQK